MPPGKPPVGIWPGPRPGHPIIIPPGAPPLSPTHPIVIPGVPTHPIAPGVRPGDEAPEDALSGEWMFIWWPGVGWVWAPAPSPAHPIVPGSPGTPTHPIVPPTDGGETGEPTPTPHA